MSNSSTITEVPLTGHDYSQFVSPSPHPGAHLREDYLPDYGLTAEALAKAMGLPDAQVVGAVLAERQDLTPDLALRLSRVFQNRPEFWMALQAGHDLSKAGMALGDALNRLRPATALIAAE